MRIVVFARYFYPEGSGAELATYLILKELKHAHKIRVFSSSPAELVPRDCCHEYYRWKILDMGFKPFTWIASRLSLETLGKIIRGSDIIYIPSNALIPLSILAKKQNPLTRVIIHLHDYQPLVYMASLLYNTGPGIRNDITIEYLTSKSVSRTIIIGYAHFLNSVNKMSLRSADRIVCVSNAQRRIITKYIRDISYKTVTIYNLYPDDLLRVKKEVDEPTFIYMGSSNFGKGFHIFLEATHKLLSKYPEMTRNIGIYLTGNLGSTLQRLIQRLNSIHGHHYYDVGRVDRKKLLKIYSKGWGLLFPSINEEPLPYAVLEAGLAGVLPIAANVGGVREIIGGSIGEKYIFRPGDTNGFMNSIKQLLLLSRDEIIEEQNRIRKKILEKFDRRKIIDKLNRVFTV